MDGRVSYSVSRCTLQKLRRDEEVEHGNQVDEELSRPVEVQISNRRDDEGPTQANSVSQYRVGKRVLL